MNDNFINKVLVVDEGCEDPAHELFKRLQTAKELTGRGIFMMGAILDLFKEHDLWKGRADSWKEFCASEAHSYSFAQTAIRLYHKYVVELSLSEDQLMKLMSRDYTSLDSAASVINKENRDEWLPKLQVLGRDDLRKEIRVAKGKSTSDKDAIEIVLSFYFNLMYDDRQEFKRRLEERENSN